MNEVMNICWKSILCNLTVSIILVQSSIADGESFLVIFFLYLSEIILASLATKKSLNQISTLYKQQIQI